MRSRITLNGREVVVLGGISNEKTVFCNESGEWITYISDEHGFNNPAGIWQRRIIDIVMLGDSFAQGACVRSDKNSAAVIRRMFPATLNLGMLGSGPLIELAQLQEYVTNLRPKIVLWFFYEGNDFGDLDNERNSRLLMGYLEGHSNQQLILRQPEIDDALRNYVAAEIDDYVAASTENAQAGEVRGEPEKGGGQVKIALPKALFLANLRRSVRMAFQASGGATEDERGISEGAMELLRRVFVTAKTTVDGWGGVLYLVYVPERDRYNGRGTAHRDETNREGIHELARALDIPVIDIHPVIQAHDDPLSLYPFRRRGHFNEDGYRIIAEAILQSISYPPGAETASRMPTP